MNDIAPTHGLGHNFGSVPTPAEVTEYLQDGNRDLTQRQNDILAAGERMPAEILDEDQARKFADFVKAIQAFCKVTKARHSQAKEPFLVGGRAVDNFYKNLDTPVLAVKKTCEQRMTAFDLKRAAAERKRREEEAAKKAAEEMAARKAAEEQAARIRDAQSLEQAAAAEEQAEQAAAQAARASKEAAVKAADLSRTRGDLGSVASLHTFWDFRDLDRELIDLEALRPHIPIAALESAVKSFIKAGGRQLAGVVIFENATTRVR